MRDFERSLRVEQPQRTVEAGGRTEARLPVVRVYAGQPRWWQRPRLRRLRAR